MVPQALGVAFFRSQRVRPVQDASVDGVAMRIIPETERGRVNLPMRAGFLTDTDAPPRTQLGFRE